MADERRHKVSLRPWSEADLQLLERLMGDPEMTLHLGGPETSLQIRARHDRYLRSCEENSGCMFVIIVGTGRASAGSIGYWEKQWAGETVWETGWSVLPEFQGRGVATRATLAVIEHARRADRYRYLHAFPSIYNGASNAVCRKLDFTLAGEYEFEYPPGHRMRCSDWYLDLFAGVSA